MHRHGGRRRWLDLGPGGWADPDASFYILATTRFLGLGLLAVAAIVLGGCAGSGGREGGEGPDGAVGLVGTIWRVEHIDTPGAGQVPLREPGRYVLQLHPGGRLGVRADCVTCVGAYDLDSRILQMQLDCPELIGCGPESQAELFLATLEQVRTFDLAGDRLRLFNLDNSGVLTLERVLRYDAAPGE